VPIYEYQCSTCGEVFEAFQKFNDEPLAECKHCRGPVEKLISHTSFQLKGSGWYLTDYARKSQPSSDDSGSKKAGASSSEKKETKTETPASTPKSDAAAS
jgi:putative FmdB family regulatory protein